MTADLKLVTGMILVLVFAYLAFFYNKGSIGIINATASGTAGIIKTLQARG